MPRTIFFYFFIVNLTFIFLFCSLDRLESSNHGQLLQTAVDYAANQLLLTAAAQGFFGNTNARSNALIYLRPYRK